MPLPSGMTWILLAPSSLYLGSSVTQTQNFVTTLPTGLNPQLERVPACGNCARRMGRFWTEDVDGINQLVGILRGGDGTARGGLRAYFVSASIVNTTQLVLVLIYADQTVPVYR
ncbi:hypothetical protein BJV78DRAFT_1150846 [Lactifluus subvellereus]|nr:hypothetical protein BJV78DRAFT_1150846 [Lactifluus subvellereus]